MIYFSVFPITQRHLCRCAYRVTSDGYSIPIYIVHEVFCSVVNAVSGWQTMMVIKYLISSYRSADKFRNYQPTSGSTTICCVLCT